MPDGDKVHGKLRFFYQDPYKDMCGIQFSAEDTSRELMTALKRAIRYDKCAGAFRMLQSVGVSFDAIVNDPTMRSSINWGDENQRLEDLARETVGKKRVVGLVLKTCKQVLQDIRNGEIPMGSSGLELLRVYLRNLYSSEVEGNIPLTEHYNGASQETINDRLLAIRPYVMKTLDSFAEQIKRRGDQAAMRLPKRASPATPIDLHETDLTAL